eukprot:3158727-Amphidinium_carterae.1
MMASRCSFTDIAHELLMMSMSTAQHSVNTNAENVDSGLHMVTTPKNLIEKKPNSICGERRKLNSFCGASPDCKLTAPTKKEWIVAPTSRLDCSNPTYTIINQKQDSNQPIENRSSIQQANNEPIL